MGFAPFLRHFTPDRQHRSTQEEIRSAAPGAVRIDGFCELMARHGGSSFNRGLYRLLPVSAIEEWSDLLESAFPEYDGALLPFGYDWKGRFFCAVLRGAESVEPFLCMLDIAEGTAYDIPASFRDFHNLELTNTEDDDPLVADVFDRFLARYGRPLEPDRCVGYRVPLFIGGENRGENVAVEPLSVYWTLGAQLLAAVSDLPAGTRVERFDRLSDQGGPSES
jgi:hypothetical protein